LTRLIEREFSQEGDLEQALELVRGCEAIPRSRALAEGFAREAHQTLDWLSPSEPRSALRALPEYVLSRLY
jgi:all-trans-nonaprenyl-diphosphate synthase